MAQSVVHDIDDVSQGYYCLAACHCTLDCSLGGHCVAAAESLDVAFVV